MQGTRPNQNLGNNGPNPQNWGGRRPVQGGINAGFGPQPQAQSWGRGNNGPPQTNGYSGSGQFAQGWLSRPAAFQGGNGTPPQYLGNRPEADQEYETSDTRIVNQKARLNTGIMEAEPGNPTATAETKTLQCDTCMEIVSLPIYVNEAGIPSQYPKEFDSPKFDCGVPTAGRIFDEKAPNSTLVSMDCGGNVPIGLAWIYETIPPAENETDTEPEKFIRYIKLICDIKDKCTPFFGNNSIWASNSNETDKPDNATMCVPGDHLTGIDITFKGDRIYNIRALCCTSALIPSCSFDHQQFLKNTIFDGDDICLFCEVQRSTREELVIHDNGNNEWHTETYKAALHHLFLRTLADLEKIKIHKNSTRLQFSQAKIDPDCPFNGTNLAPNKYFEFFVLGGREDNVCGSPVVQRAFVSEPHGIVYSSKTARAAIPASFEAVMLPRAIAWAAGDPCLTGCGKVEE